MNRLTHPRSSGIKTGHWSPNKKDDLVEALAAYENTGLSPQDIYALKSKTILKAMGKAWIPCSERLPEEDGEYLVWYDCGYCTKNPSEDDEKGYMVVPFDTEQGAFGCWQGRIHPDSLGFLDEEFVECNTAVAWMPLPEPYREEEK